MFVCFGRRFLVTSPLLLLLLTLILTPLALSACGVEESTGGGETEREERSSGPDDSTRDNRTFLNRATSTLEAEDTVTPEPTPRGVFGRVASTPEPAAAAESTEAPPDPPGYSPPGALPVFPPEAVDGDYDHDDDGLLEIRTLAQLDAIRLDPDGTAFVEDGRDEYFAAFPGIGGPSGCPNSSCMGYELAAHLDFDTNGNGEADAGDAYWNDGSGWQPLRLSEGAIFDGNGYSISNLFINARHETESYDNYIGLFGWNSGVIRNLVLTGIDVNSDLTGEHVNPATGGLAGMNYGGAISNSMVSGDLSGVEYVGGLVGRNDGMVSGSSVNGNVTGVTSVGGLVGLTESDVSGSTAAGTVSGEENVGGLVGFAAGAAISGCRSESDVSGRTNVGGLVGLNNDFSTIGGSQASGDVTGAVNVGGLVGQNEGGSNLSNGGRIGSSEASGRVLGKENVGGLVGLSGQGGTISESAASGVVTGYRAVGGLAGSASDGWVYQQGRKKGIILNSVAEGYVYGGFFVGGLVGMNRTTLNGSTATGDVEGVYFVGGLVGNNDSWSSRRQIVGGIITGSIAEGHVTGFENVGGLSGRNGPDASVEDSSASGAVSGATYRGALVGVNEGGPITNSEGTGNVSLNERAPRDIDALLSVNDDQKVRLAQLLHSGSDYDDRAILIDHEGRVKELRLLGFEIEPVPGWGSMTGLTVLEIDAREIPPWLGRLIDLQELYLRGVSGEIPPELGNLANLKVLDLGYNQLSGEIPLELGNLSNLTLLDLYANQLSGEIPLELGNLINLQKLHLAGNQLSGEIPPELGNLINLQELWLWGNQLSGCVSAKLEGIYNSDWNDGPPLCE